MTQIFASPGRYVQGYKELSSCFPIKLMYLLLKCLVDQIGA